MDVLTLYYLSRQSLAVKRVWLMHDTQVNDTTKNVHRKRSLVTIKIKSHTPESPKIRVCVPHHVPTGGQSSGTLCYRQMGWHGPHTLGVGHAHMNAVWWN